MMQPKLSIGSWAFAFGPFQADPWSFSRILRFAKEAGYEGIEINGFYPHPTPESHPTSESRKALKEEIEAYGLGISGYAPDFASTPPAIVHKEQYLESLQRYIDFSKALGVKVIRVDTVSPPEPLEEKEYERRFAQLVSTWRSAGELASKANMTIVWEFEPGFWLNKPSEVRRLINEVNHDAFKVLFDTSHAYMSGVIGARHWGEREILPGGIVEYARLLEGHIGHVHVIDSDGTLHDEETSTHAAFGKGLVDFSGIIPELISIVPGMEWWCVDFCFNSEVEEWSRQAVPFIRGCIREVE